MAGTASGGEAAPLRPGWRLQLGGPPQLLAPDGRAWPLDRHGALIAARLALAGPQPREQLAQQLWPDADSARARGNLRQRLLRLKALVGAEWIRGERTLSLAPGLQVLLPGDAEDLLPGLSLPECDELDGWLQRIRTEHRDRRLQALATQAAQAEAAQRLDEALAAVQQMLAIEPHVEHHHRLAMRLHYLNHDGAGARAAFARLQAMLLREFDAAPDAATLQLLALIERGLAARTSPSITAASPAPGPMAAPSALTPMAASSALIPMAAPSALIPMAAPSALLAAQSAALARPPRLVGRDAEAAALLRQLARRGTALLFGEGGIGKSRLLAEVCAAAPAQGLGLLATGARPGDAGVPYALAARWLRALLRRCGSAPPAAWRPVLAQLLPELDERPAPAGDLARLVTAVQALLDEARGHGVAGHVVDDLQYADEASVELLQSLVGAGGTGNADPAAGSGWLLAMRPAELGPAAQALRQAHEADAATLCLHLQPLDAQAVVALLDALAIEGIAGASVAQALLQHSGGNPLYLLETLKAGLAQRQQSVPANAGPPADMAGGAPSVETGRRASAIAGEWPVADSVLRLIQRRLARLSPLALKVARCAALAGADLSAALVAHVLRLQPLDLADAWAELQAAQVLGEQGFAHDLIAEAALGLVPPGIAPPLHADIAGWLEQHDGEPVRTAAHWLAAALPQRAVPHLRRAALRADALAQHADAARWHEQAAGLLLDAGDRDGAFDERYAAAQAYSELGRHAAVEACLHALQSLVGSEGQRAMCACVHFYLLVDRDRRYDEARPLVLQALPQAQRAGLVDVEVELLWDMVVLNYDAQRLAEALGWAEQALARLEAVDLRAAAPPLRLKRLKLTMASGLIAASLGRGDQGRAKLVEARRIALHEGHLDQAVGAECALASTGIDMGDAGAALRWSAQAVARVAQGVVAPGDHGNTYSVHAQALCANGDLGGALDASERAVQAVPGTADGPDRYRHRYLVHLHLLQFELGRRDLARKGLHALDADDRLLPAQRALQQATLLAIGEHADANLVLDQARATDDLVVRARLLCLAGPGCDPAQLLPLLVADAQAALARGALGLWLDLLASRLAALRVAGDPATRAERRSLALALWQRVQAGVIGRLLFPQVAAEIGLALALPRDDDDAEADAGLAQAVAMQASAWMLRAASTLPAWQRRSYLTQAPVLRLFGRGLLTLPAA